MKDFYKILGVRSNATLAEIKRSYLFVMNLMK